MVGYISNHIKAMAEKEKLDKKNSLMELKNLVKRLSHSDKSDTTDSFSDTTIEKNNAVTTEESSDASETETTNSNEPILDKSLAIAITQLVKQLVEEFTQPHTVSKLEHNFNLDANAIKKIVHEREKNDSTEETDAKNKKEALYAVRLNTLVDKIKNKIDKILITDYNKIIKAAQKSKYRYKIYEIPYHKKTPLIDDVLNALNNYKGFEYIAYADSGLISKPYKIYIKLDYIWDQKI